MSTSLVSVAVSELICATELLEAGSTCHGKVCQAAGTGSGRLLRGSQRPSTSGRWTHGCG